MDMGRKFAVLICLLSLCVVFERGADALTYYNMGSPSLTDIWVDPLNGSDFNAGDTSAVALKTLNSAWSRIPSNLTLATTGYRINLLPGSYPCEPDESISCENYFQDRLGTYEFPVIIRAANGPGTVTIRGGLDLSHVSYLYLIDLTLSGGNPLPTNISGNNLLHFSNSDHVLLRGVTLSGPSCADDTCNNLQEVLKVNQTQYLYVEDSTIGGAWHSSVDCMVVQYGHFLNNRIHTAGQWCMYLKGGASYFGIQGNELYGCQLGFEAGQAANFAVMRTPWLHYDAYDVKFVNNVLHDIPGVGMGVAGGYNILFAFNTLYNVGTDASTGYGLMHFIHGERNCTPTDELQDPVSVCGSNIGAGGWGPNFLTESFASVPNRNVYVYNNIFYNPAPSQTLYSHFVVEGSLAPPAGFVNFPSPSKADDNLVIRGNVIWNGPSNHPLGIEDASQGCQADNPTCNERQLRADNSLNTIEPQLIGPGSGNFRPRAGGTIFSAKTYAVPDFTWSDAPAPPSVPQGALSNAMALDRDGSFRNSSGIPGAYETSCTSATLSPSLKLHVPAINVGGSLYTADFEMDPAAGGLNFKLLDNSLKASDQSGCNAATFSQNSSGYILHVPTIVYNGLSLWVDFQLNPGSDGTLVLNFITAGVN